MMLGRETWSVAFDALRANKLRAFLTMLGVMIGAACIVLVVTVSLTGRRFILGQIESIGTNVIEAHAVHSLSGPTALNTEVNPDDVDAIRKGIPGVLRVGGTHSIDSTVVVNGSEHPVNLVGVTQDYQDIRHLVVVSGRYYDEDDVLQHNKVCLITQELSQRVFGGQNPVGQNIRLGEITFSVIGTFREAVQTFGLSEIKRDTVLIPFPLIKYYTGADYFGSIYVQMDSADQVVAASARLEDLLLARHPTGSSYEVQNLSGILGVARQVSEALTAVLVIIAFIALVISGIGIMNIMLVTVTERTREIGIRRAIGARRKEILYQFLLESILISGGGAILGVLGGVSIPVLAQPLLPDGIRAPVPWYAVVLALGVSCLTGVFFGYLPASKAAALQPTESLRYE
jgi:putative ABC transport system permease protein